MNPAFGEHYDRMMSSGFYAAATEAGLLIEHEEVDDAPLAPPAHRVLEPRLLPFVSHPYEWCFSQLKDAALLTLRLQKMALEHDLSLKDASAYNVQFDGGTPVFIDTLSFEPYREGEPWVAYEQYCRHFLAPLALMTRSHVDCVKLLRVSIDGIPLDMASRLLPFGTRFSPSLLIHIHLHARMQSRHADDQVASSAGGGRTLSRQGMLGIVDSLRSATSKLSWSSGGTEWADYYDDTNYSDDATDRKRDIVDGYLDEISPRVVWDLGANTGVYSRRASGRGIHTVAFDVDPSAVERNYLRVREQGESHLLPLVQDLTNPSPDLGWDGRERDSLEARGPADLVMALALIHHLCIGNNVPLDATARFFARVSRSLVIEFVPKGDSQVDRLLATRTDIFPDYTREGFEAAFSACFTIRRTTPVEGSTRLLYLMDRRD